MAPSKSFVIRIIVYSIVLGYGVADLMVFHGPLHRRLQQSTDPNSPEAVAAAKARGEVARVYHHPITVGQLERAVARRLWLEGKKPADLPAGQLRLVRYAAINDLIDHQLLRIKAKANALDVPVSDEEIEAELALFTRRFRDRAELDGAMKAQGIGSEKELRFRIAGRIQQEKYIESRIKNAIKISDDEARAWFDKHRKQLRRPERLHARHIFLATLERSSEEARKSLESALKRLQSGKANFAALAVELSEDERTKANSGDLGWFSRQRLPAGFTKAVFALPDHTPTLVQSKIGWHLVEVLDRKPAEPLSFDEAKPEILAALQTERRRYATRQFLSNLRHQNTKYIHIFRPVIDSMESN